MGQFSIVLLAIDNAHTVPQRALNCPPNFVVVCGSFHLEALVYFVYFSFPWPTICACIGAGT